MVIRISNKLYRVYNKRGLCKDVWVEFGKIKEPINQEDILTETEIQEVELELEKNKL